MCNGSCVHLNAFKTKKLMYSYSFMHAFYVSCITKDSFKRKARECLCMKPTCKVKYQRVHACLSCLYLGCFNAEHIHEHAKAENHYLAMDTNYGHVYCFICEDYQYDPDLEKTSRKNFMVAIRQRGSVVNCCWKELHSSEFDLLNKHQLENGSNIGLRGIVNLGNTCYMSVIVQSLVHAPIFREYLLTSNHKCDISDFTNTNGSSCFACEMSDIILEFFSGKREAFVPDRLLHLLWTHVHELKGDYQQDAHHCFLALLNNLHLNCLESSDNSLTSDHSCKCIIDTIFTGLLQYEYTCTECKNVSIQSTSFKDISLDLELHSHASTKNNGATNVSSLDDCLRRAMQGYIHSYTCSKCHQKVGCSMQMTLKKLPLIISFHLKQSCNPKGQKIFINFPEFLDMSEYMLSPVVQNNMNDKSAVNGMSGKPSNNKFYLFAIVEHEGTESGGHYKCYVRRHKDNWFSCDDVDVHPVRIENVLKIKAYLLFYHRQTSDVEFKSTESEGSS